MTPRCAASSSPERVTKRSSRARLPARPPTSRPSTPSPRAEAILKQIFANAPVAIRFSLEAVNRGLETGQAEGMALEASLFGLCAGTEDKNEGAQAFLQKRAATFKGR